MKHLKLFEQLNFVSEEDPNGFDGDRVTINAMLDGYKVGSIVIEFVVNAFRLFEDEISEDKYFEIFPDDKFAKIEHLEVYDKYKGKRYARHIMEHAIKFIKESGEDIIYLNACPMGFKGLDNNSLFRFYKSFGFETFIQYPDNEEMFLKLV